MTNLLTGNARETFRWTDTGGSDERLRCTRDHKVVMSRHHAKSKAKLGRMKAYQCGGGFWHIGHRLKSKRRGPSGE